MTTDTDAQPEASRAATTVLGDPALVVQVSLAEFNKLRDEIAGRSTAFWTLLGLNVTASGTVAGLVIGYKADPALLLLLPLLTPSLGLLAIDHTFNIARLGRYIDAVIKPMLRAATGNPNVLGNEETVQEYERHPVLRLLPFGIPLVVLFTGIPVGALIVTAYLATVPSPIGALWWIGLIATLVQIGFWGRVLLPPLRRAIAAENQ